MGHQPQDRPGKPPPPPEALLIRRSREALDLTPVQAAEKVEVRLGERRWRQLEDGDFRATDKALAHMAAVVSVTPEELEAVGRGEAAEILRRILAIRQAEQAAKPAPVVVYPADVAGDDFLEHIWCYTDVPEGDRFAAVQGVIIYRRMASGTGSNEQAGRRMA